MKLLCFQVKRFRWKTHAKSLAEAPDHDADESVAEAVVVFLHAEKTDEIPDRQASILRQTLKHIKWLANKGGFKTVVLHSFTHLGGDTAAPGFAAQFIESLAQRLGETHYHVRTTPFGFSCEWELNVYGDSLAKVWKQIR